MADKLTIKQEKYAQGLFAGLTQREAYKQAYDCQNMTAESIDVEACKLANAPKVIQRIRELQEVVSKRSIWTVEEILKDIKAIALDPEAKRLEKLKALELGGKHLGMFTDKVEAVNHNINNDVSNLTEEERKQRIAELRKILEE